MTAPSRRLRRHRLGLCPALACRPPLASPPLLRIPVVALLLRLLLGIIVLLLDVAVFTQPLQKLAVILRLRRRLVQRALLSNLLLRHLPLHPRPLRRRLRRSPVGCGGSGSSCAPLAPFILEMDTLHPYECMRPSNIISHWEVFCERMAQDQTVL